jgi:hypothetical protein
MKHSAPSRATPTRSPAVHLCAWPRHDDQLFVAVNRLYARRFRSIATSSRPLAMSNYQMWHRYPQP